MKARRGKKGSNDHEVEQHNPEKLARRGDGLSGRDCAHDGRAAVAAQIATYGAKGLPAMTSAMSSQGGQVDNPAGDPEERGDRPAPELSTSARSHIYRRHWQACSTPHILRQGSRYLSAGLLPLPDALFRRTGGIDERAEDDQLPAGQGLQHPGDQHRPGRRRRRWPRPRKPSI